MADFDKDGKTDLLFTHVLGASLRVYWGGENPESFSKTMGRIAIHFDKARRERPLLGSTTIGRHWSNTFSVDDPRCPNQITVDASEE